jgi:hypothetical protein
MEDLARNLIEAFTAGHGILSSRQREERARVELQLQREKQQAELEHAAQTLELAKQAAEFVQAGQKQELAARSQDPRKSVSGGSVPGGLDLGTAAPAPRPEVKVGGMSFPLQFIQDLMDQKDQLRQKETAANIAQAGGEAQARKDVLDQGTPVDQALATAAAAQGMNLTPGTKINPEAIKLGSETFQQKEATKRTGIAAAARNTGGSSRLDPNDPDVAAAINSAADRVAGGEITADTARGLLGGVKSGLGVPLLKAIGDRRVLPPKVREQVNGIGNTRSLVDQMGQLVDNVIKSKDPAERLQNTALLEQYGGQVATLLARGFGERGVVTEGDAKRATGLAPGWKAANFAPGYAKRELALLHQTLDRVEKNVTENYFQEVSKNPGAAVKHPDGVDAQGFKWYNGHKYKKGASAWELVQ